MVLRQERDEEGAASANNGDDQLSLVPPDEYLSLMVNLHDRGSPILGGSDNLSHVSGGKRDAVPLLGSINSMGREADHLAERPQQSASSFHAGDVI